MTEVRMAVPASREDVFRVLSDGWLYAAWVVGTAHIRAVDPDWPSVGSRIHHSVAPWPLHVHDTTEVKEVEPPRFIRLDARIWPFGAAEVQLELSEAEDGGTVVRMTERIARGPGSLLPAVVQDALLTPRNRESLTRLCHLARGHAPMRADRPVVPREEVPS